MKTFDLAEDLKTFGFQVKRFPDGIDTAFNELIDKTGDNAGQRNYFGISECKNSQIFYYAVAEEKLPSEAAQLSYQTYTINAGKYLVKEVSDWKIKTDSIKEIFTILMQDEQADKETPAIEWYKSDKEMWCMLKTK